MTRNRKSNPFDQGDSTFSFGSVSAPGQDRADRDRIDPSRSAAIYNEQQRRRYAMDPRLRTTALLCVCALVAIPLTSILPTHLFDFGGFDSSVALVGNSVMGRINALSQIGSGSAAGMAVMIYLSQIVAVAIAGAALALNGAVYQGAMKNALASPSTLGVMSGATLGNLAYTLLIALPSELEQDSFMRVSEIQERMSSLTALDYAMTAQGRTLCCLAGCAVVVALVLLVAFMAGRGRISKVGLLVTGQVFTAVIASIVEMVQFYLRDFGTESQQLAARNVVGGSFDHFYDVASVALMAVPVLVGIVIVMALRNRLNLLSFDDDEARSMGISVNSTRVAVIAVCTVLTAVIVSFCGSIGFVGFIVPHLARKLVGPDFRYFIPASIFLGALYLTVAYYLMNMSGIFQGSVGTFTSVIGVVFFAVMAVRQRARGNADWL